MPVPCMSRESRGRVSVLGSVENRGERPPLMIVTDAGARWGVGRVRVGVVGLPLTRGDAGWADAGLLGPVCG
jgi:hypothetical protein